MRTVPCPNCGSKRVRTGKTFLPHLARLALGSRRRYCGRCRNRWIGEEKIYSPWARFVLILLLCGPALAALVRLQREGWFEPQPRMYETADGREALLEDNMAAENVQRFSGVHFTERYRGPLRLRTGQSVDLNAVFNLTGQRAVPLAWQSQEMQQLLSRVSEAVRLTGKTPLELAHEIDQTDKQTLWDKYGGNFASKEEAKAAYSEFKANRGKIKN